MTFRQALVLAVVKGCMIKRVRWLGWCVFVDQVLRWTNWSGSILDLRPEDFKATDWEAKSK